MIPSPLSWTIWGFFGRKKDFLWEIKTSSAFEESGFPFPPSLSWGFLQKDLLWERKSWSILIRNHDSISTIFDELRFFFFFFGKNKFYWGKEEELEHFEETWFHHHLHHFFWADVFCRRDFCWGREELEQFEESWFHHLHHILWAEDGCFFGRKIWLWEIRRKMAVLCHCKSQILSLQQQQKRL